MKKNILILIFIINLLTTSAYIILKYFGYTYLSKIDFTLLVTYDILSFIMLGELIGNKEIKNK